MVEQNLSLRVPLSSQLQSASDQFVEFANLPDVDPASVEHRVNEEVQRQKDDAAEPATVAKAKARGNRQNLAHCEAELPAGVARDPNFRHPSISRETHCVIMHLMRTTCEVP